MRALERTRDRARQPHRILDRHRAAQGLAVDVLHDQVVRTDVVQRADIGMVQRSNRPRLLFEPARVRTLQRLDRHDTVESRVARLPDIAHVARAERGEDFVGADDAAAGQEHGEEGIVAAS